MPPGVPVGILAVGQAGAINAALLAVAILGNERPELHAKLREARSKNAEKILATKVE